MQLVKYETACRAVAEAKSVDEVKEIKNYATAARAYARQAKNRQLELDALEIRTRAERRLGEMIIALKKEGNCVKGAKGPIIKLKELDIDGNISQISQRLASLSIETFDSELAEWRTTAEHSSRVEVPLQRFRNPSQRGNHQRGYARAGRIVPGPADVLRRFKDRDGRLIRDWRLGELRRIESESIRAAEAARRLREECPVANADALATVEMVFGRDRLEAVLSSVFEEHKVQPGDSGLMGDILSTSKARRTRQCEHCSRQFVMRSTDRAGRFCSRECAFAAQKQRGKL